MTKQSNTGLYVAGGLLLVAGIAYAQGSKPKDQIIEPLLDVPTNTGVVAPLPLDLKLTLQKGVSGQEVAKLQSYLGISDDGVFGLQTEATLLKIKGVKKTTLETFAKLPTLNQNRIGSGSRIMAENKNGAKIYLANQKADKSYFRNDQVLRTIDYGKEIGEVRSSSALGNWYLVKWTGGFMCFVLAADVKKI